MERWQKGHRTMRKRHKLLLAAAGAAVGTVTGGIVVGGRFKRRAEASAEQMEKLHTLYMVFDQWLALRQEGKSLKQYFIDNNYRTVAIYGMRELGERLYSELNGSDVIVKYAIDKNADAVYTDTVDVVTPGSGLEPVDVIVVTAIHYFDAIKEELCKEVSCPVVSLADIIAMKGLYEAQRDERGI